MLCLSLRLGKSKLRSLTLIFCCAIIMESSCPGNSLWGYVFPNEFYVIRYHVSSEETCICGSMEEVRILPLSVHRHSGEIQKTEREDEQKHQFEQDCERF